MTALSCSVPPPEIDVFTIPHTRMKSIIERTSKQLSQTDFSDGCSMKSLLKTLSNALRIIQNHEKIEDEYVMQVLKSRLHGFHLRTLLDHLATTDNMDGVVVLINSIRVELQNGTPKERLLQHGVSLRSAVLMFYSDYLPHMIAEEKVFQPLLNEYFSHEELKQMRRDVFQSHNLRMKKDQKDTYPEKDASHRVTQPKVPQHEPSVFDKLPQELTTTIFSYLGPKDLCRCAQVCKKWNRYAFEPFLWKSLYPSLWSKNCWAFHEDDPDNCNCDCELNYELLTFRNEIDEFSILGESGNGNKWNQAVEKELKILMGICRYVLPKVGRLVVSLYLGCSKALTNGVLFRLLSQCPNIEYLDISQTIISDLGLKGLFKGQSGQRLRHLDLSGCYNVTDETMKRLANAWSKDKLPCQHHSVSAWKKKLPAPVITYLSFSGCFRITDNGLDAMSKLSSLPALVHLDLSGCNQITGHALNDVVRKCPNLNAELLFYCDNISEGPFEDVASGCQNLECRKRYCCRNVNKSL